MLLPSGVAARGAEMPVAVCESGGGPLAGISVRLTLPPAAEAFAFGPSPEETALARFLEGHAGETALVELVVRLREAAGPGACEGNLRSVESDTLLLRLSGNRLLMIERRPEVRPDSCRPVAGGFRWAAPVRIEPPPADASLAAWTLRETAADPPGLDEVRRCLPRIPPRRSDPR